MSSTLGNRPHEEGMQPFRSGFATVAGRPNVGKSTLVNRVLGQHVSIVSDKPQTTRMQVRGILQRPDAQVVFVDTPGLHKPRTALGERTNASANEALTDVDAVCLVLDASKTIGRGDDYIATRMPKSAICVLNKIDGLPEARVFAQLQRAAEYDLAAYFPVSARTGRGVEQLVEHIIGLMPEGPRYYEEGTVSDLPQAVWVAELVREQLLHVTREELPHSIATRVTEWEWPRVRCEIVVERDSQKGIAIGKNGAVLKAVGERVRKQLPPGAYIELHVTVLKDWQQRPDSLDRLGF